MSTKPRWESLVELPCPGEVFQAAEDAVLMMGIDPGAGVQADLGWIAAKLRSYRPMIGLSSQRFRSTTGARFRLMPMARSRLAVSGRWRRVLRIIRLAQLAAEAVVGKPRSALNLLTLPPSWSTAMSRSPPAQSCRSAQSFGLSRERILLSQRLARRRSKRMTPPSESSRRSRGQSDLSDGGGRLRSR